MMKHASVKYKEPWSSSTSVNWIDHQVLKQISGSVSHDVWQILQPFGGCHSLVSEGYAQE